MPQSLLLTAAFLATVLSPALAAEGPSVAAGEEAQAREFVSLLMREEFAKAAAQFDATMAAALPTEQLQAVWTAQVRAVGPCQKIEATRTEYVQQYRVVFVTCRFEKQSLDIKVVLDPAGKVSGLFFVPTPAASNSPPPYAKPSQYQERDVLVGSGDWTLPGTLTMPIGPGPFPAVVLVHGSGPNDRDETVGANKPFRDLAWGLASRGIAVLRYEKRTRHYRDRYLSKLATAPFTVQDETVTDAVAAVALLRKTAGLDARRLYVLGHSLGGMLVPRIAAADSQVAGFIVLAGNARPLEELILEQTEYQLSLTGSTSQEMLKTVREQVSAVKQLSQQSPPGMILGAPTSYWLDLRGYQPTTAAQQVKSRLLILQGEEDCQVSFQNDFALWRQALSHRKDVTFKSFPGLNHLFIEVQGKSSGAEYQQPGHVAEPVVKEIATWIGDRGE